MFLLFSVLPRSGALTGRVARGSRSVWRSARCSRRTLSWRERGTRGAGPAPRAAVGPLCSYCGCL